MKNSKSLILMSSLLLGAFNQAQAEIIDVSSSPSTLGATAGIIAPPSDVLDDCATGEGQLGFDEAQGIVTSAPLNADDGVVIPKGTLIDSHMIFFNLPSTASSAKQHAVWTFKRPIIAVMSNPSGSLEAASTAILGAPATNYRTSPSPSASGCKRTAPFTGRGLDTTLDLPPYTHANCPDTGSDCYSVDNNAITLVTTVGQPGDWIRVITQGAQKVSVKILQDGGRGCISANNHQVIMAAILGNAKFDVSTIDTSSITLGGMSPRSEGDNDHRDEYGSNRHGREGDGKNDRQPCEIRDINKDGIRDMVCKFEGNASSLSTGNIALKMEGSLQDGTSFKGSDTLCVH